MNKRIQKKVAKRNGGVVKPHNVATPKQKSRVKQRAPAPKPGTRKPEGSLRARDVARALMGEVRGRAAGAVAQIGERLAETEQRAETLIAKVPGVGPKVAKKLRKLTRR